MAMHAKRVIHIGVRRMKARRPKAGSRPGRLRAWLRKSGVIVRRDGVRLFG